MSSDEFVEALEQASLTEAEQDFIDDAIKRLRAVFDDESNVTNELVKIIWEALVNDRKVRLEKLAIEPGDLVLAKFETDKMSGGAELHHFTRGLKDLLPAGTPIIIIQNEAQLESLDVERMKSLGWQPVPEDEKSPTPEGSRGPGW